MNDLQPINFPGLDPRRPLVIAGPCSAETEEQVIETARELAAEGFKLFRAGLWKPRTKPGGFEGVGVDRHSLAATRKTRTGMYTATEVATRKHVLAALEGDIDMIWIGARTTANPFAMQEIVDEAARARYPGAGEKPRESRPRIVDWRWNASTTPASAAWVSSTAGSRRSTKPLPQPPDVVDPYRHRRLPGLQIFQTWSHIGGRRELIALSQQAEDLGLDGLIAGANTARPTAHGATRHSR